MECLRDALKCVLFLLVWPLVIIFSVMSDKWEWADLCRVGISFAMAFCVVVAIALLALLVGWMYGRIKDDR
jgi:predicted Na+-dependent transporter